MALKIAKPTVIKAAGNKEKIIEEYFGLVNSQDSECQYCCHAQSFGLDRAGAKT